MSLFYIFWGLFFAIVFMEQSVLNCWTLGPTFFSQEFWGFKMTDPIRSLSYPSSDERRALSVLLVQIDVQQFGIKLLCSMSEVSAMSSHWLC